MEHPEHYETRSLSACFAFNKSAILSKWLIIKHSNLGAYVKNVDNQPIKPLLGNSLHTLAGTPVVPLIPGCPVKQRLRNV
jgi:hypothetical protein